LMLCIILLLFDVAFTHAFILPLVNAGDAKSVLLYTGFLGVVNLLVILYYVVKTISRK